MEQAEDQPEAQKSGLKIGSAYTIRGHNHNTEKNSVRKKILGGTGSQDNGNRW
jgi:hypothetical protein